MEPPPPAVCFVLGAGFSCAFSPGAPTMADFLARAAANGAYKPESDHRTLASIAEKYFGSTRDVNIEDLASFLVLDLGSDPAKEKELRNLAYDQLIQIICQTLGYIHGPAMSSDPADEFSSFATLLAREGIPAITFN